MRAALLRSPAAKRKNRTSYAVVEAIEACARIALAQPYYPDTNVGVRQEWVKRQIAASILALLEPHCADCGESPAVPHRRTCSIGSLEVRS